MNRFAHVDEWSRAFPVERRLILGAQLVRHPCAARAWLQCISRVAAFERPGFLHAAPWFWGRPSNADASPSRNCRPRRGNTPERHDSHTPSNWPGNAGRAGSLGKSLFIARPGAPASHAGTLLKPEISNSDVSGANTPSRSVSVRNEVVPRTRYRDGGFRGGRGSVARACECHADLAARHPIQQRIVRIGSLGLTCSRRRSTC